MDIGRNPRFGVVALIQLDTRARFTGTGDAGVRGFGILKSTKYFPTVPDCDNFARESIKKVAAAIKRSEKSRRIPFVGSAAAVKWRKRVDMSRCSTATKSLSEKV